MKKLKNIFLILVICLLISGCSNKQEGKSKEKIIEEIAYVDTKIVDMLNKINNISIQNYEITSKQIKMNKGNEGDKSTSSESSGGSESQSSEGQGGSNPESQGNSEAEGQGNSQGGESSSSSQSQKESSIKVFELSKNNILQNDTPEIDWNKIKTDIAELHSAWDVIILDLYKMDNTNNIIETFGNSLNNCIITIKNEDKIATMTNLCTLYNILPEILNQVSAGKEIKTTKMTKSYVLSSYSAINQNNWDLAGQYLTNAENEFLKLMNDVDIVRKKEGEINSIYIGIKELQKSLNTQDTTIFFMNYKNLIEKINVL